jgi:hypothetical protein
MVETLDEWPTKEDALPSPLLEYMDGEVYRFTADDAQDLGYGNSASAWHFENALYGLKNDLMLVSRTTHGPWQAKSMTVDDGKAVIFQFTGVRDCRKNGCVVIAEDGGNGFCLEHQKEKSNG